MYVFIHCRINHSSQDVETKKMSNNRWLVKNLWHTYTMEYYTAARKDKILPFDKMWMNFESITLSKIKYKEDSKTNTGWIHSFVIWK